MLRELTVPEIPKKDSHAGEYFVTLKELLSWHRRASPIDAMFSTLSSLPGWIGEEA